MNAQEQITKIMLLSEGVTLMDAHLKAKAFHKQAEIPVKLEGCFIIGTIPNILKHCAWLHAYMVFDKIEFVKPC